MRSRWRNRSALVGGVAFAPIAIVVAHSFVDGFAAAGQGVIFPEVRDALGLSLTTLGLVGLVAGIISALIGLPVAQWCDRHQRKPVLVVAIFATAACAVMMGVAQSAAVYVVASSLFALFLYGNDNAQGSLLADYTPIDARPTVYYGRRFVSVLSGIFGPLLFGILTFLLGWRAAVLFLAVPAVLLGLLSLRLKEPHRGGQERAYAGLSGAALELDDESVPFGAAARELWAIPTVRLSILSWILLGGGLGALGTFIGVFFEDVLGLGALARGALLTLGGVIAVVTTIYGARLARGYLDSDRPERLFHHMGALGVAAGGMIVLVSAVPHIVIVIAGLSVYVAIGGLVWPAYDTVNSVVMPARIRTVGFAVKGALGLPGLLVFPLVGIVSDIHGVRWGMVASVPVFVTGGLIFVLAARHFAADEANAIESSVATARGAAAPLPPVEVVPRTIPLAPGLVP